MKKFTMTLFLSVTMLCAYTQGTQDSVVWGNANSRTEQRDNAGLQGNEGARSGFFETYNPINFPAVASGWWHLLDVRHSNPVNNLAMQFAGSFYDQQLYFRKVNTNPSQPWSRVLMETNGKVGINTTNPRAALDLGIVDTNKLANVLSRLPEGDGSGEGTYLGIRNGNTQSINVNSFSIEHRFYGTLNSAITFNRGMGSEDGFITFSTMNGQERMRIERYGNVGIGTNNPQSKLAVAGTITAQRVKVTSTGWPDYVFQEQYQLPSLEHTEKYITTHKHLPGMPTAAEIEKDGQDVGEMNKKLLEKVEELTLHLIALKKEIAALRQEQQR